MVDAERLALWGTSFSGGHVIVTAAQDQRIAAIVSQVPFTDGLATAFYHFDDPVYMIKGLYHGFLDVVAAIFTNDRHNVRIVGRPGEEFAILSTPDSWTGYTKLVDKHEQEVFERDNFCPANIIFTIMFYKPISYADKVNCPSLVIGAEKDTLMPTDGAKKTVDRMKKATYISLPMGHFEPYVGEPFEKIVTVMGDFLQTNLR
jgi:pimeloyl-ACP methyl ester carboxylesterase